MNNAPAPFTNILQQKYRGLRHLLAANTELLEMLADIEADLFHLAPGECKLREAALALLDRTLLLIQDLDLLAGGRYRELFEIHGRIEARVREYFQTGSRHERQQISYQLREVDARNVTDVGGKAANLGEVIKFLPSAVPPGFVITTAAYRLFIQENDLHDRIRLLMKDMPHIANRILFKSRTEAIRSLIRDSMVPASVAEAIAECVKQSPQPTPTAWAVRSSAVGEDGQLSFAGQFDSFLNIPPEKLQDAYRSVLASRYSDRAVQYRLVAGSAEVDTPMAVLFMPMVPAKSAGVIYTRDPQDAEENKMLINSVRGLAEQMVQGQTTADMFVVSRNEPGLIYQQQLACELIPGIPKKEDASLTSAEVKTLVEMALKVEKHFGHSQDIEWAIDEQGRAAILQTRELRLEKSHPEAGRQSTSDSPLLSGGTTIFAGRAVGEAWVLHSKRDIGSVPEGAVLVVEQATPEIAVVLPKLAGLIAAYGNPAGHAATLIREFAVPSLFGIPQANAVIKDGQMLSLDATRRAVYEGVLWADIQERVQLRIRHPLSAKPVGFLHEHILALNLVDPQAVSFRPKGCRSVHDIIRFVHEKAVATMFDIGDKQAGRLGKMAKRLKTDVPLNLVILDLGGGLSASVREQPAVHPEDILSSPFRALWNGITHPGVKWTGRAQISAAGFASVIAGSLTQGSSSARGLGTTNYLMIGTDYLCLNARLAYHFAMIDTMIGNATENNYVNFRFRGGGAGSHRRDLRAEFLTQVLLRSNFGVDHRGDLVTAWLRRYPQDTCEEGLSLLGKLMGCARQLDMVLDNTRDVSEYAERFLQGDYGAFA
jgi:pyruvate, water dikinase